MKCPSCGHRFKSRKTSGGHVRDKILAVMNNDGLTAREIAELISARPGTISRYLSEYELSGQVRRIGWKIVNKRYVNAWVRGDHHA